MRGWLCLLVVCLLVGCDKGRTLMVEGNRAYLDGRTEQALVNYKDASSYPSVRASALVSWGRTLVEERRYEEGLERLNEGLALEPFNGLAYYYRGLAQRALNSPEKARQDLEWAVKIEPGMGETWLTLAQWQHEDGDSTKADASLEIALRTPSVRKSASLLKAQWAIARDDHQTGRLALERLLGWYPYSWEAHLALAELYLDLERPDLAKGHLLRADRWADSEARARIKELQDSIL